MYKKNMMVAMICPAYAGMILTYEEWNKLSEDLSRVCGDDPALTNQLEHPCEFVPRMRG